MSADDENPRINLNVAEGQAIPLSDIDGHAHLDFMYYLLSMHQASNTAQRWSLEWVENFFLPAPEEGQFDGAVDQLYFDMPYLLHGVVTCRCSLEIVQRVYKHRPEAIREKDIDGLLPLHAALMYYRNQPLHWATIRFLIDEYPQALEERAPRRDGIVHFDGKLPLHALLWNQSGEAIGEERLDLFLPPDYEHTIFQCCGRDYYVVQDYDDPDKGVHSDMFIFSVAALREQTSSFSLYFIKKLVDYAFRAENKLKLYGLTLWLLTFFSRHGDDREAPLEEGDVLDVAIEVLLRRHRSMGNNLHHCPVGDTLLHWLMKFNPGPEDSLATRDVILIQYIEAMQKRKIPLTAVLDDHGDSPLHRVSTVAAVNLIPPLVRCFPSILTHRNRRGQTAFESTCAQSDQDYFGRFDSPLDPLNAVYALLRVDPVKILTQELFVGRDDDVVPQSRKRNATGPPA